MVRSSKHFLFGLSLYFGFAAFSLRAFAFPEMQRHGYTNCTSCHLSPNGGGVLTEYGRALAKELLSTWGTDAENRLIYFVDSLPPGVYAGGDLRALYLYRDTPRVQEGKWIIMQADVEAFVSHQEKLFIGGTIGVRERPGSPVRAFDPISRRHFLMWKPFGDEYFLRVGRFHPAYGLNVPDHASFIKRSLGFDQGQENYNFEASFIGESWNLFATGFIGQPDLRPIQREKGAAVRVARTFGERVKLGLSYYYGAKPGTKRHLVGPYAIVGLSERVFWLSEVDFQFLRPENVAQAKTRGLASFQRLGWEMFQGFIPFLSHEDYFLDVRQSNTRATAFGLGVQWFPRPHWDFLLSFQKQKSSQLQGKYTDAAWLQTHFYF